MAMASPTRGSSVRHVSWNKNVNKVALPIEEFLCNSNSSGIPIKGRMFKDTTTAARGHHKERGGTLASVTLLIAPMPVGELAGASRDNFNRLPGPRTYRPIPFQGPSSMLASTCSTCSTCGLKLSYLYYSTGRYTCTVPVLRPHAQSGNAGPYVSSQRTTNLFAALYVGGSFD
jgi:hypothetical protein